jgi:hypothetical protein
LPTLNDWLNALSFNREIEIISSRSLISNVQQKQLQRSQDFVRQNKLPPPMKNNLTPVFIFNPSATVTIQPISLLHSIGRITTPPVPNLADLSSTWAIIRYLWAFEPAQNQGQQLLLSSIARQIDFHQKVLLSDEIGMGMAYYIMTEYFNTTEVIDASIALQKLPVHLQYSTSPDFLFFEDLNKEAFIVECKGNQSSYPATIDQLRRGTEQVPSLIFQDGRSVVALVIATCMLSSGTNVYIIDPENDSEFETYDKDYWKKAEKIGPNRWRVTNDKLFTSDSILFSRAKTLTYAGADAEAIAQLPSKLQEEWAKYVRKPSEEARVRTKLGDFSGIRNIAQTIDRLRVEIYRGILNELRERLYIPSFDEKIRAEKGGMKISPLESFTNQFEEKAYHTELDESRTQIINRSICRDGTIFQLTISEA